MDSQKEDIIKTLKPLSSKEAREAIYSDKIYSGAPGEYNHEFALGIVAAKEAEEQAERDIRSLSIAERALRNSERATIIATSAMILSIATTICIAIFQWLYKN
jgi:hypothetical protein